MLCDTTALLKLYLDEPESDAFYQLICWHRAARVL
jgi:hypothetical protein